MLDIGGIPQCIFVLGDVQAGVGCAQRTRFCVRGLSMVCEFAQSLVRVAHPTFACLVARYA